jgi:hypothetical protein
MQHPLDVIAQLVRTKAPDIPEPGTIVSKRRLGADLGFEIAVLDPGSFGAVNP